MFHERTAVALILSVLGIAAYATVRPTSPDPVDDSRASETWFYVNKTHQRAVYDGVVIGDSRALRGVSPSVLTEGLGRGRAFNFAFSACGMESTILAEAEKLLAPESPAPYILLAPTALSFQTWKRTNAQFHEYRNKPADQVWLCQRAPQVARWLQPVAVSVYVRAAFGIVPAKRVEQEFHADGWLATDQEPRDERTDLADHRTRLAGNAVDSAMVAELLTKTRTWTSQGIRVFGFYPPAEPERTAMEDSVLDFDRAMFADAFSKAGGIWLEVETKGLRTYDGSHLDSNSALRMSRDLAAGMKAHWDPALDAAGRP